MIYERFDPTLEKYKPQTALSVTTTAAPLPVPKTSLLDLWKKYTQFQQAHLEETTIIRDYGKIEKRIRKFPKPYLEDAIAIQAHLLSEFAAETAKRTLKQLSAC
jgi:integrase